jgi:hypothetical protein
MTIIEGLHDFPDEAEIIAKDEGAGIQHFHSCTIAWVW